jgi:hypothetical protein
MSNLSRRHFLTRTLGILGGLGVGGVCLGAEGPRYKIREVPMRGRSGDVLYFSKCSDPKDWGIEWIRLERTHVMTAHGPRQVWRVVG